MELFLALATLLVVSSLIGIGAGAMAFAYWYSIDGTKDEGPLAIQEEDEWILTVETVDDSPKWDRSSESRRFVVDKGLGGLTSQDPGSD